MLTRIRGLRIRRSSFHAVVLIDGLSVPWITIATRCSTRHHIMMCHLLCLLLWMHPIATTHGMRLHSVLRIRVLMSRGFQGITIPSRSAYVLVTISIATHSFCRQVVPRLLLLYKVLLILVVRCGLNLHRVMVESERNEDINTINYLTGSLNPLPGHQLRMRLCISLVLLLGYKLCISCRRCSRSWSVHDHFDILS